MKITSLIDNVSHGACTPEHGLSLFIELECGAKVLFDMGQGDLFADNAEALGIRLQEADLAVVSHGHYDHGGGLNCFLSKNHTAKVYIRKSAFERHDSIKETYVKDIGLSVPDASRLVFCGDCQELPYGITLFSNPPHDFPQPDGNRLLLGPDGAPDSFDHEQSMLIREGGKTVLFGGCAHRGIINILHRSQELGRVTHVFSGMHIGKGAPTKDYLDALALELRSYDRIRYYTMHCTGETGFSELHSRMGDRISYLSCGESIIV